MANLYEEFESSTTNETYSYAPKTKDNEITDLLLELQQLCKIGKKSNNPEITDIPKSSYFIPDLIKISASETEIIKYRINHTKPMFCGELPVFPQQKILINMKKIKFVKMVEHSIQRDGVFIYLCKKLNNSFLKHVVAVLVKIQSFQRMKNHGRITGVVLNRIYLKKVFFMCSSPDVYFGEYENFHDDLTEINFTKDSAEKEIKLELDDLRIKMNEFTLDLIECGINIDNIVERVKLNDYYSNIEAYSYYITSLVDYFYEMNKNEMQDIFLTQDPIRRLYQLLQVIESFEF